MSKEIWPKDTYPRMVSGHGYILTGNATKILAKGGRKYSGPYVHLEDVFFTGIVAEENGVTRNEKFSDQFCKGYTALKTACPGNPITVHYVEKVKYYFQQYLETCYKKA